METVLPNKFFKALGEQGIPFTIIKGHKDISDQSHVEVDIKTCEQKLHLVEEYHDDLCKVILLTEKQIA